MRSWIGRKVGKWVDLSTATRDAMLFYHDLKCLYLIDFHGTSLGLVDVVPLRKCRYLIVLLCKCPHLIVFLYQSQYLIVLLL